MAGGLLSLILITPIFVRIFKYIKRYRLKGREVHPIVISEIHSHSSEPASSKIDTDARHKVTERNSTTLRVLSQNSLAIVPVSETSIESKTFAKAARMLSMQPLEELHKTSQGANLLASLDEWWKLQPDFNDNLVSEEPQRGQSRREIKKLDRVVLLSSPSIRD